MNTEYTREATDGVMLEASFLLAHIEHFGQMIAETETEPDRAPMLYAIERIRSMILEASANTWRQKFDKTFDLPGGGTKCAPWDLI